MKFDFDDILLTPEVISTINTRSQVNPYDENNMLPIMTAPMDTVVSLNNCTEFYKNKIYSILPRDNSMTVLNSWNIWNSYGLKEFKERFLDKSYYHESEIEREKIYVLIDVANGHMSDLYVTARIAKEKYGDDLVLMIGNIANPNTFAQYSKIGVDYIRCGIGGGQGCLTSVQTGVGYPMGSLINECYELKKTNNFKTKIVADGGFKKFADINKALALGADYVMLGSMLNKCLESAGTNYDGNFQSLEVKRAADYFEYGTTVYKLYRGMSTKEVQKAWGKEVIKTAEGISKFQKVEYNLSGFVENLEDYLKSAMSYTGSKTLEEFKETNFELITPASFKRFDK